MSYRVLVAEDEAPFARTVARFLEERGQEVRVSSTGKAARRALESSEWDVLLLDLKLPDADGADLLAELRESQSDLQTIIVTGFARTALRCTIMPLSVRRKKTFLPRWFPNSNHPENTTRCRQSYACHGLAGIFLNFSNVYIGGVYG